MPLPRPAPGTGRWWVIGVVGVAVMSLFAVWFGISSARGVQWSDAGHRVVSDTQVQVTFDVTHQNGKAVSCTLEALNDDHGQVGKATFGLPASSSETVRYTRTLRTASRAVTGSVDSCRYR